MSTNLLLVERNEQRNTVWRHVLKFHTLLIHVWYAKSPLIQKLMHNIVVDSCLMHWAPVDSGN